MASTLKPQDAFDYAKHFIKDMPLDKVLPRLVDDVSKLMWMAAPWRWTLGSMPVITLASATTDYSVTLPGDFLFLHSAYLTDGTQVRKLRVEPTLPVAVTLQGQPSRISIINSNTARISPKPGSQPSVIPNIISLYKKMAPTIAAKDMNTAGIQGFDDEWFWVFQEGLLWRAYQYAEDQRAGSAQVSSNGQIAFTGQRAVFEAGLQFMKANEKLPEPEPPEER